MFAQKVATTNRMADLEAMTVEELDPCCQKEINLNRERERINKELRAVDRSYERLDRKLELFNSFKSGVSLSCRSCACSGSESQDFDYPSLRTLRDKKRNQEEEVRLLFY